MESDISMMRLAIKAATQSKSEVPVGAALFDKTGKLLASSHNLREQKNDPTAHAEIQVIRDAAAGLSSWRLGETVLFVTLEPCVMCAGAIVAARIPRVVFGAWDQRVGASGSIYDLLRDPRLGKPVEVVPGVLESECSALLQDFFVTRRDFS